jgi:hypothetical protein
MWAKDPGGWTEYQRPVMVLLNPRCNPRGTPENRERDARLDRVGFLRSPLAINAYSRLELNLYFFSIPVFLDSVKNF